MADIIGLSGQESKRAGKPNQAVIDVLSRVLKMAEDGQVQQVAVVWVDASGIPGDGYAPGGTEAELFPVIAGVEVCKATLLSQMI